MLHLLSESCARQLWRLMLLLDSVTTTGYCSNCFRFSIYQGRLPQEIVPVLYSECIVIPGSLAHCAPSTPHLSASTLVFLSLSPPDVFMIALSSWSRPPLSGICKLASVQLHTHTTKGAISSWIDARVYTSKSYNRYPLTRIR